MISHNETELMALGEQLGKLLEKQDVMILSGDLGAGKTTFTKGLARGLGIKQMIKSPTYTIVREYEGRLPLYHMDVYRIGNDPILSIWTILYMERVSPSLNGESSLLPIFQMAI